MQPGRGCRPSPSLHALDPPCAVVTHLPPPCPVTSFPTPDLQFSGLGGGAGGAECELTELKALMGTVGEQRYVMGFLTQVRGGWAAACCCCRRLPARASGGSAWRGGHRLCFRTPLRLACFAHQTAPSACLLPVVCSQPEEGRYAIEDLSARLPVDLSGAGEDPRAAQGWAAAGSSFALVDRSRRAAWQAADGRACGERAGVDKLFTLARCPLQSKRWASSRKTASWWQRGSCGRTACSG